MRMKNVFLMAILFVVVGAGSASAQTKSGMRSDSRRAISLNTCVTFENLPQEVREIITQNNIDEYVDESTTNGMSPKTAKELGWDTKGVWNERPGHGKKGETGYRPTMFCFSLLDSNAVIDTLNQDSSPRFGYLHGCKHATIKNFKNRIIIPPPTFLQGDQVEVPCKKDEKGMTLRKTETLPNGDTMETWYDECNYEYKVFSKIQLPGKTEIIAACPVGITVATASTFKDRAFGGIPQAGISGGASAILTAIRGGNKSDIIYSTVKGIATQRVEQALNPGESVAKIYLPGFKTPFEVHRGENKVLVSGIVTRWKGDHVFVVAQYEANEYVCGAGALKSASNVAVWTDGEGILTPTKTLPTGPGGPTPIRPRVFTWAEVDKDPRFGGPSAFTGGGLGYTNQVVGNTTTPATRVAEPVIPKPKFRLASNMRVVDK